MPFPQLTVTPSPPTPVSASTTQMLLSSGSPPQPGSGCCESGRPILTDPTTGQTICSCQYLPGVGLIGSAAHRPHAAMAADSLLASAYAAHGYLPFGPDANSICAALGSPYDLKDAPEAIRTLAQSPAYYTYDPSLAAAYPYSYGPLDLNSASRRKNATRENTTTLKAWLYEHRKNPYPTKGEKIMLAIITKMTLTQVSTWFANARRRLKKENKMTWSPRPGVKDDEDDDDDLNESRDSASGHEGERSNGDIMNGDRHGDDINLSDDDDEDIVVDEGRDSPLFHIPHPSRIPLPTEEPPAEMSAPPETGSQSCPSPRPSPGSSPASCSNCPSPRQEHSSQHEQNKSQHDDGRDEQTGSGSTSTSGEAETSSGSRTDKNVNTEEVRKKPKIWSLADVATSRCTPSSSSTTASSTLPVLHRPGIPSSASQSAGNPALITTGPAYPPLPPHYHNGLRPPWLNGYSIGVAPYMLSSSAFQSQEVAQRGLAPGLVPMGTHVDTRTGLPIATYGVPTAGHPAMIAPPPNLLRIPQPHVPQPHHPQHAHHHPKHAPESLRAPSPHAPPPLPARPLPTHGASSPPRRIPSPSSTSTSPSRPSAPPSSSTTHSSPPSSQSLFTPLNMIKMPSSSHH